MAAPHVMMPSSSNNTSVLPRHARPPAGLQTEKDVSHAKRASGAISDWRGALQRVSEPADAMMSMLALRKTRGAIVQLTQQLPRKAVCCIPPQMTIGVAERDGSSIGPALQRMRMVQPCGGKTWPGRERAPHTSYHLSLGATTALCLRNSPLPQSTDWQAPLTTSTAW
jgi:hypothetical protein